MSIGGRAAQALCALGTVCALPALTVAQETPTTVQPADYNHGDNGWMLVASALVLLMTARGLAMFYGGLVRKKNVLGVIMQCVFLMGLMAVLWATYGYSLAFGTGGAYIGDGEFLFMEGRSE